MNRTDLVDDAYLRTDLPAFRPGDTVKVHVRVVEGNRERTQVFQGVVIRRQNGGLHETFTVRKISFGVGVERTFPLHSPSIAKLEIVSRGRVRRAKLYYLRERRGKKARIKERRVEDDVLVVEQVEPKPEVPEDSMGEDVLDAEAQAASEAEAAEESADAGTADEPEADTPEDTDEPAAGAPAETDDSDD